MDARPISEDDVDLICRHREEMFRDAGGVSEEVLETMMVHFREWLRPQLRDGSYFGFVLSDQGRPVAGIGLRLLDWAPHPKHPTQDKRGYVLNVYLEPDFRRRGLATELMRLAEEEFAKRGIQYAVLHATAKGHAVYEGLDWNPTSEMSKQILD